MKKQVTIVGAGLSGIYAAVLLEKYGIIDYLILEAKDSVGGRIVDFSVDSENQKNTFDLGPSWIWPEYQTALTDLLLALGIEHYPQYAEGEMLVERSVDQAVLRYPTYQSEPESRRIHGGMGNIINALVNKLSSKDKILTSCAVKKVSTFEHDNSIHVECQSIDSAKAFTIETEHVLLAMPPRLIENSIAFTPALPTSIQAQWKATLTWMAPQAKYFAIFDKPFWREQNLSGDAHSTIGPLVEIRDASIPHGKAALLGFFGIPAKPRAQLGEKALKQACREQLLRLYGEQATPTLEVVKDWAQDSWTCTKLDTEDSAEYRQSPPAFIQDGLWRDKLTGIGSEWSKKFPGLVAGAIDAADIGVKALVKKQKLTK